MSARKCGDVDWLWTLLPWATLGVAAGFGLRAALEERYDFVAYYGLLAAASAWHLVRMRGVARRCANRE